jgi:endogenous inhibitor of DNA gyrase (YacG/DUF329 family)
VILAAEMDRVKESTERKYCSQQRKRIFGTWMKDVREIKHYEHAQ